MSKNIEDLLSSFGNETVVNDKTDNLSSFDEEGRFIIKPFQVNERIFDRLICIGQAMAPSPDLINKCLIFSKDYDWEIIHTEKNLVLVPKRKRKKVF